VTWCQTQNGRGATLFANPVDLILGNDLAGEKVIASPCMLKDPEKLPHTAVEDQIIYPACAVARAMSRRILTEESNDEERSSQEANVVSVRNNTTETSNTESTAECH